MVLAESLRRSRTSRRIGVIASRSVSNSGRISLRKKFDDIFLLDPGDEKEPGSGRNREDEEEIQAKIFAFSLDIFEKCVFLEPNSILLENADGLFETEGNLVPTRLISQKGTCEGYHSSDFFLIMPYRPFGAYLEDQLGQENGTNKILALGNRVVSYAREWMENNFGGEMEENLEEAIHLQSSVMMLSLATGEILEKETWNNPKIIQFVSGPGNEVDFVRRLEGLSKCSKIGLTEKAIIQARLNLSETVAIPRPSQISPFPNQNEPIAIIGISCRLPGANNLEEFWNLLFSSSEGVREPPPFRWRKEHCVTPVTENERKTNAGFLKTSVDEFDAKFFGVSPKEAVFMDPQTRLLHEVIWESLENGGVDPSKLYGSHTGIFTGSWMNDYRDILQWSANRDFFRTYMGNSIGASAARLSHLLGITGPCIATESGCSSAIVAVDMAVKSLRSGETSLALAGGVNLLLHPFTSKIMDYVIAPDGRCKTFDAKADGFGRAEGCGFLVLKRLGDALRDQDHIWAMVRGSAVSQEGISRSLGTPTIHCEALAMELALKNGGVRKEEVSFVETHGTGTGVGDPMEVAAIGKAYGSKLRKVPLVIGSVKTNVGHTESCSGITGIIKTVLAMKHELIPKHLNLETLNPDIKLEGIPAQIPVEPIPWPRVKGEPRLAGVSSFGITGTDGHVIIQEPPEVELPKFRMGLERPLHILKISAKTGEALQEMLKMFEEVLGAPHEDEMFADFAYTGNTGRASFDHRALIVAADFSGAADAIRENKVVRGEDSESDTKPKLCFLFTGQGSQYPGMAKSLYETTPVFRHHFDHCSRTLESLYQVDLKRILWEEESSKEDLKRTIYSQTSIFCVEYCLLRLWESWGLQPDIVVGHSLGEFCAAVAAGFLELKDALKLVAVRSRLIDQLPSGSMLVLKANRKQVEECMRISKIQVDLAAVNSPDQTVVAGDTEKIEELLKFCKEEGLKGTILEATHAFHSSHMDAMLDEYRNVADGITYHKGDPNIQFISSMEGKQIEEVDSNYWVRHTRQPVSFLEACKTLKNMECFDFVEVGPHPVLSTFVLQNLEGSHSQITCYPSLRRNTDDWDTILTSLGKLWLQGCPIDWIGFDDPYNRKKVSSLPFYPFQRKSFWVEVNTVVAPTIHPLIGSHLSNASRINMFQNDLIVSEVPYLRDHCIGNKIVFPGAGFTEMCLAGGYCVANFLKERLDKPRTPIALEDVTIEAPLELKDGKFCRLQVIVDLPDAETIGQEGDTKKSQGFRCKVFHRNSSDVETTSAGKWVGHATATFYPSVPNTKDLLESWTTGQNLQELISSTEPLEMEGFYKRIDGAGLKFGETFRSIRKQWLIPREETDGRVGGDEVITEIKVPEDFDKYLLHPLVIDAMFQTQILASLRATKSEALRVPVSVGRLILFNNDLEEVTSSPDSVLYIHVRWRSRDKCSVFLSTSNFTPVALMEDLELLETNTKTIQSVLEQQNSLIPDCWEEIWKPIFGPHDKRVELVNIATVTSTPQLQEKVAACINTTTEDATHAKSVDRLVTLYLLRALYQLGWTPQVGEELTPKSFLEQFGIKEVYKRLVYFYLTMLRDEFGMLEEVPSTEESWRILRVPFTGEEEITSKLDHLHEQLVQVENVKSVTLIYQNVAENMAKVLRGEESALQILFPVEPEKYHLSAEAYYQKHPARLDMVNLFQVVVGSIVRKMQDASGGPEAGSFLRVLEVGAGTGSLTYSALKELKVIYGNNFEYYYTDISASFFIKADKQFEEFRGNLKFATFNIEESPLSQGIPVNYFDCVVASDVLHAVKDLKQAVRNLRMTMRPKGLFSFTDTLVKDKGITFVFGLLEGYWRFEDLERRPHHSCISSQVWRDVLLENGFSDFHCCEGYLGVMGCISAEASGLPGYDEVEEVDGGDEGRSKRWIVFSPDGREDTEAMLKVAKVVEAGGNKVDVVISSRELEEDESGERMKGILRGFKGKEEMEVQGIVYAWGMGGEVDREQKRFCLPFLHICKHLLEVKKPPRLYLFTRDVHAITENSNNPSHVTLWGMAKSLKNENPDLFVRCIDLEQIGGWDVVKTDQLFYELAMFKETREKERLQVAYRDRLRYEPRLTKVVIEQRSKSDLSFPPSADRYQLILPQTRVIKDLEFGGMEVGTLGEEEVEVETKAYALNFRDIFAILKPSPEFESINGVGLDFAGVVTRVGGNVPSDKLKVGDRVFGVNFKDVQLPSHLICGKDDLLKIPNGMTFSEASTLPAVFATSIYCLVNVAKLKKGETVLIHTGSGGVGLSAIQMARKIGANIITTAGSPRKRAYLRGLGIEHVFHSRNTSYQEEILKVTGGRGVDVVLNSLTGPGFKEATLAVCSEGARFIEMSKLSVWTVEEVKERRPDVEYSIVDLTKLERKMWAELLDRTTEYLEKGEVTPIPFVRFDALRVRQALQYFQKAKHIGKVVVTMPEVRTEQGQWISKVPLYNSDSTYLITGGLGGIGFEVCKWMLDHGATDIVLMGRSEPNAQVSGEIEKMNERGGVNVTVKICDVGNYEQCRRVLEELTSPGYKPLRGIHHCAGVLWDNMYENQTWETFTAAFNPKVNGSWNLHKLTLHLQLEYFIFYSSFTALVGTPGQANHSSANCFEDAFARYRHSLGLPAASLNWGQWSQVGCAKEVNVTAVLPVSVARMLNGLEEVMRSQRVQVAYGEFESLHMWSLVVPTFKHYVDEKYLKSLNDMSSQDQTVLLQSTKFWQEIDEATSTQGKMEVVMNYMKVILASALRMDADEGIKEDANMQDLGVDSLMLIELRNSIQSLLGSRLSVTANMLKDCQTIRQLATVIVNKIEETDEAEAPPLSAEELEELLNQDCVLEEDIQVPSTQVTPIKTVLLTGATGQLGPYVLDRLCKKVDKVICLIRTRDDTTSPDGKLKQVLEAMGLSNEVDMSKIQCLKGDLAIDNFGLPSDIYDDLCDRVDAVIHLAAKSNHVESYRKLEGPSANDVRSINVGGTLRVIKFCVTRKTKVIYYASSILTVWGEKEDNTLSDNWPEQVEIKQLAENVVPAYPCSKFVCEMLFKQACERGLPCKVFRLPWILGHSETGRINYHGNHYILRFITYLKLKSMPSSALPAIVLPVDTCADWSLSVFWNEAAPSAVYNITHPTPDLEVEFTRVAKDEFGVDMELVEWTSGKFVEKLYATDMPLEALKDIYDDLDKIVTFTTSKSLRAIQGYINYPEKFFLSSRLEELIPGYREGLPSTTEIIRKNLNFVRDSGGFKKFGL